MILDSIRNVAAEILKALKDVPGRRVSIGFMTIMYF